MVASAGLVVQSHPPSLNGSTLRPIIIHQPTLNETFKRLLSLSLSLSLVPNTIKCPMLICIYISYTTEDASLSVWKPLSILYLFKNGLLFNDKLIKG